MNRADQHIHLVGFASGLGAADPGCGDGPDALRANHVADQLQAAGRKVCWQATVRPEGRPAGAKLDTVSRLVLQLARAVGRVVQSDGFPVVLGGDHSCAIGTWGGVSDALQDLGPVGLIWIDAHLDAHTPQTSPSGALHGMPLACLLGVGAPTLTGTRGPKLLPQHVALIGARDFEPGEAALLMRLGVRVFGMDEVTRRGVDSCLREALTIVRQGTVGYGVSVDLDTFAPEEAPGVGTPAAGGMCATHLIDALACVRDDPQLLGIEIAEFNPHRDRDGLTAEVIMRLLFAMLPDGSTTVRPSIALEQKYGAQNYETMPVVLVKGQGVHLWDEEGKRYLDMMSAYSAVSHGHAHPRLVSVLSQQAGTLGVTSRSYYNDRLAPFLRELCEVFDQERALPVNTGLEAVETAIKAARKWAYKVKGVPADQAEIIACDGNFHGRSLAIVGMSSEPRYREGFGPFPAGFRRIPYGKVDALEQAITPNTAALLVEPIQGEAGIVVPPQGYLAACAQVCREHNVLLLCDEVQTGLGRTGKRLACDHENVRPDGLILGKALGGGLLPVSAFLAREEVMNVFTPGTHGSTFGGNPLAAAVGLEALRVLNDERLAERSAELGSRLLGGLQAIGSALIREVRGRGLFIGIEINPAFATARDVVNRLLARGILTKDTHETVVRIAPPLVITMQQIDWALHEIAQVFTELETRNWKPETRRAATVSSP